LVTQWSKTALVDDLPGGTPPVVLNSNQAPAAEERRGVLAIIEGGVPVTVGSPPGPPSTGARRKWGNGSKLPSISWRPNCRGRLTPPNASQESSLRIIHTGRFLAGLPTLCSWLLYGLGSDNENLPAYVVLGDPGGLPVDGERNWSSGFLPAIYQGTPFRGGNPLGN